MNKLRNAVSLWSFTIAIAVILCSAGIVSAAMDYNPPAWRGSVGSTVQSWAFNTDTNPLGPDAVPYDNSNGAPALQVNGAPPNTQWLPSDLGHTGVWRFEDNMVIDIPNFPQQNPYKEVWLQMTFYGDTPIVNLTPFGGTSTLMNLIDIVADGPDYWNATFQGFLDPNPVGETIHITPRNCSMYIDDIVVDTICVPEPMTLSLLGVGGLALLRKRKRR